MLWQPSLPDRYLNATEDELGRAIDARRRELGSKLLILGHHYQQDDVIRHADLIGDSLKLSQMAAAEAPRQFEVVYEPLEECSTVLKDFFSAKRGKGKITS